MKAHSIAERRAMVDNDRLNRVIRVDTTRSEIKTRSFAATCRAIGKEARRETMRRKARIARQYRSNIALLRSVPVIIVAGQSG
ncbi:MAG: hypothetical protein JWN98_845 [Abditibacteriota bacterium]|nr:hypothetical protein [Abditibacteriota bacterium]